MALQFNSTRIDAHRELADKIKEGAKVDAGNRQITEVTPGGTYMGNLPEGLTPELVAAKAAYDSRFLSASHVAVGELAAEIFNNDQEAKEVSAAFGYGDARGKVSFDVTRQAEYRNSFAKEGEPTHVTKHLVMSATVHATSNIGHGLKALREDLAEQFVGSFKK